MKQKSRVIYEPLIDKSPSLTAMHEAEIITPITGQRTTVFTLDQQLYKIVMDVMWSDTLRWNHMIQRLGGMHWLMSFFGCIGVLMENGGLVPWLERAFTNVSKMLTGKKFPKNVRALGVLVLELLRGFVDNVTSFDELQEKLDSISQENILAEREGEFFLHLYACTKMLTYFFVAGHINYTRYGLCYLVTI